MALVIDGASVKEYFNTNKDVIIILNSRCEPNLFIYTYVGRLDNAFIYVKGKSTLTNKSSKQIRIIVNSRNYVFETNIGIISLTYEDKTIIINKSDLKQVALWLTAVVGITGILSYFGKK